MERLFFTYFESGKPMTGGVVIGLLARLVLGGAFVWAGVVKMMDPGLFLIQIRSFEVLPDPFAALLALGLPPLEVLAGLAVVLGIGYRGGLTVLTGALVLFLIVIGQAWVRGLEIDCGCFGASSKESTYVTLVVRDIVFLALAGLLWWQCAREVGE